VEELEDHTTPKPNEERTGSEYYTGLEEDEDESVFVSPLKARKKPASVVANSDIELTGTDDGGLEAKKKGKKKMNRQFRAMVQEKRAAMTTTANNKPIKPPAGHSKVHPIFVIDELTVTLFRNRPHIYPKAITGLMLSMYPFPPRL
jgi:hypothetical protein